MENDSRFFESINECLWTNRGFVVFTIRCLVINADCSLFCIESRMTTSISIVWWLTQRNIIDLWNEYGLGRAMEQPKNGHGDYR